MTLPGSAVVTNFDAAADDPKLARPDLKANWDKFNLLLTHLNGSDITKDPLTVGDGLEKSVAALRVQLQANPGLARAAAGLILDLTTLAAETSPAAADLVAIYDATAAAHRKSTIPNLLKGGSFANLSDVIQASSGQFVQFNGSNYVGAASPLSAGSVTQSKLSTATEEESNAGASASFVIAGGEYAFYPHIKSDGSSSFTADITAGTVTNTSYETRVQFNGGAFTNYVRFRYIQASPPYDLGDGEVPLFVFLVVDAGGNVVRTYTAPEPPWANNGPTDIRPEITGLTGKTFRKVPRVNRPTNAVLRSNPAARAQYFDSVRTMKAGGDARIIEITQALKQADMPSIPHPFASALEPGETVVLLDPPSDTLAEFLLLQEQGESIASLLHGGYIAFGNSAIPGRKGPPGVLPVSVNWKP